MTRRLPIATLLVSLAAHGGALALLLFLVSGESPPSVLFVDLDAIQEQDARSAAAAPPSGGGEAGRAAPGPARPAPRAAARAGSSRSSAPAPAHSPPAAPLASAAAAEPESRPEREVAPDPTPEPRQPEPPLAVVPARAARPAPAPSSEVSPAPAEPSTNDGGGDRVASTPESAGRGQATPGRGASGPGSGGTGGPALASGGQGGGAPGAEYSSYLAGVRRRIVDALRYPPPARRRGLTGTVYLEIFIRSDGAIGDVAVTSSSAHPLLDEAALDAVRSLEPQPFPKGLKPRPLRVRLPVVFDLQ